MKNASRDVLIHEVDLGISVSWAVGRHSCAAHVASILLSYDRLFTFLQRKLQPQRQKMIQVVLELKPMGLIGVECELRPMRFKLLHFRLL